MPNTIDHSISKSSFPALRCQGPEDLGLLIKQPRGYREDENSFVMGTTSKRLIAVYARGTHRMDPSHGPSMTAFSILNFEHQKKKG